MPINTRREIRAAYTEKTIRVYQAYSQRIAEAALLSGTFSPPHFKLDRMTWIKPSFLWMMYRSGWATKKGQERILAIDITREGFEWALHNSALSIFNKELYKSHEGWKECLRSIPVRIEWDPGRNIHLEKSNEKAIQIGLSGKAVSLYVEEWITSITDVTSFCHEIRAAIINESADQQSKSIPEEKTYPVDLEIQKKLHMH